MFLTSVSSPVRKFTNQKAGPGQKRYTGLYLTGVLPGGERVKFRANFAKIGREAAGSLKFENDFSSTLAVINTFFDDLEPST